MNPETYRKLAAAGLTHEQMAVVFEVIDERDQYHAKASEARKAQARERVQRWRDKQPKDDVTLQKRNGNATLRLTRAKESSSLEVIDKKEERKKDATSAPSDLDAFRSELSSLDAERLAAIIKLRKAKRGQLTALAARLFIADAAAAGLSLPEAVDTCISRNWITVKADWLDKPRGRGSDPPREPRNAGERAYLKLQEQNDEPPSTRNGRLDPGDGRRQIEGTGLARRFAVATVSGR